MNNPNLKELLGQIYINSAELAEYEQADGSRSKTLLVKIPHRSLAGFRKVSEKVVHHLEGKFNWPVIVVATRNIVSKRGKYLFLFVFLFSWLLHDFLTPFILAKRHRTQKRPRSRTLTAVHAAVLEDIVILIIFFKVLNYY